jgi:energy-coupling factor transporter ATP-binding protein EcfA2
MQPLYCLSGGQKARAALALLLAGRPQLLILDEPTNHLDLDTVEALVRAIQRYEGAVVVASHDVRFVADVVGQQGASDGGLLQNISGGAVMAAKGAAGSASSVDVFNGSSVGEVYVVGKGAISRWDSPGGMQAYAEKVLAKVLKEQGEMLTTPRLIGRQ